MIKNKGYPFSKRKFQILNSKFQISKKKYIYICIYIYFKGLQKSIKFFFLKGEIQIK